MKTYCITYKNPNISPIVVRASSLRVAINNATRQLEKQRADLYARGFTIEHLRDTQIQDTATL